ncbi:hypothetical protein [Sorangium sp. So ce128]|uniref:hypothetical protein n=1 Tax=Sorangium sp. So ce128 TaxID=3133281 RepID=UPI003F5F055A
MHCPTCGRSNAEAHVFCPGCGVRLSRAASAPVADPVTEPHAASAPAERSLEERVGRLEREVQALIERRSASMRDELRCPACGARKILHAPKVLDADADGRNELAIAQPSVWRSRRVGKLEAYICAGCMLVEWHVKDLEGLDEHVDVSALDGEAPRQGPYR